MVYEAGEDSERLRKYVGKYAFGKVLDIGAGSGVQAIEASKSKKVSSVLAVDIDKKAIKALKNKTEKGDIEGGERGEEGEGGDKKGDNIAKIKIRQSDLFSNVKGKFDTIIFNPPYLPEDKEVKDKALYGGKKGHEVLERFLDAVGSHLSAEGTALIVFSSLTNKKKIDSIIEKNLLEFKELEKKHFFFEDLFVYRIVKSRILKKLDRKGIFGITYLARGKRGNVFAGHYKNKKAAVKIKRKESLAMERVKNEVKWLKILNRKDIGPKLLFYGDDYLVYEFAEGDFILDWIKKAKRRGIKNVLISVLNQCFEMDCLKVNKEEMHRPIKHIVIGKKNKPVLIDFERCYKTKKPHNVTQFVIFLIRNKLTSRKIEDIKGILGDYKKERSKMNFNKVLKLVK